MTFSPFLCLIEEIMQCFFVNGAKIVFNSFRYNKSLKPKKERMVMKLGNLASIVHYQGKDL